MGDSSLSLFHNSPVEKKKRKRWVWIARLCRARRQHWCSALFSLILFHSLSKGRVSGPCWCRHGDSPGLSGHVYPRAICQLLTEQRGTEKNLKNANSNSRLMCCSIISSCVNFTDSKPLSDAILCILCIMINLLLSHLGSLCPQHSLSFSCCSSTFSSEQKYFSAWLEVLRCFNLNSLGLFETFEFHSTSPM